MDNVLSKIIDSYAKLKDLVKSIQLFDIDERKDERAPNIKQIYIKDKRMKKQEVED